MSTGLFTAVGGTLENGMSAYVTQVSSAISSALVAPVTMAATIWVITYGLAVIRGEAHEPVPAFAWRAAKVTLLLAFALSTGVYQSDAVDVISGATSGLAQTIETAAASTGAGNTGCSAQSGTSVTATSATSIYESLDCYDQQNDIVMNAYFNKAAHEGMGIGMIASALGDVLCGLIAGLGGSIFLIVLAFEVVMARMMLDLVLGLGPLFIACGAFAPTVRFFEAWTAKVANYALLQVLVAAFLGMALTAFSADLLPFNVTSASPVSNASLLMSQVQSALDGVAADAAAVGMFVTGVFLAMIGWQLPSVAAGLAGGATLSGFASFAAGMASRSLLGSLVKPPRGGRGSSGGVIDRVGARAARSDPTSQSTSSPGPVDEIPAYQRVAREHLGKDEGRIS